MTNEISVCSFVGSDSEFVTVPFYFGGKPLGSAFWGMTLLNAGTMRFRWNETNPNREKIINYIEKASPHVCSGNCIGEKRICDCKRKIVPVELIHSKIVVESKTEGDTQNVQADGIVTKNRFLVPTVTVADCVPLFLYDTETGAFGSFHSGWKGTGIIGEGVRKMTELYGSKPESICAAIGPHIGDCCYMVDEERAGYFRSSFGGDCVSEIADSENENCRTKFALSLTKANLFVLEKAGVKSENIVVATDCTCCSAVESSLNIENGKKNVFGSFRRQAAFLDLPNEAKSKSMTVQAAFCFV
ncbi:MAG: polyphenol oxidase family protein [Treponema sp.]|nr:polyphenol oxidase family protein [Treponema sp.]